MDTEASTGEKMLLIQTIGQAVVAIGDNPELYE